MKEYISFDCHKHYTLAERESVQTGQAQQCRIEHRPGAIREYLSDCEPGTKVALEATSNWYWIVQEIEEAGCVPLLVHPGKARARMANTNKTDGLDVHGMNVLQRCGTLPTVWIPPAPLRDLRELTRTRMALSRERTRTKNRITAQWAKYGVSFRDVATDAYGRKGRRAMQERMKRLPPYTAHAVRTQLSLLDFVEARIAELEKMIAELIKATPDMQLLKTLPGIGPILSTTAALEIGKVGRFRDQENLATYSGTTPRVHSSGGHTRLGPTRKDVNHYLKWAFWEAANSVALNVKSKPDRYLSRVYTRVKQRRNHSVALGAVARHLAEAAFQVLKRQEAYKEPVGEKEPDPQPQVGGVCAATS
jgi:transposase